MRLVPPPLYPPHRVKSDTLSWIDKHEVRLFICPAIQWYHYLEYTRRPVTPTPPEYLCSYNVPAALVRANHLETPKWSSIG